MASLKKNFAYNLLLTGCNYIFPLITYPYVSRVLGVTNIGTCAYVNSIIQYFMLFSMLGIGSYGVREIARFKEDKEKRDEVFTNLFFINFITTVIALLALFLCTYFISSLYEYRKFLCVGSVSLLFNMFITHWFFQGISDFKFITIRSVILRCVHLFLIFIFVKNEGDVLIYFTLNSVIVGLNALINWNYGKRYRSLTFSKLHIKDYIIPVAVFGFYLILTSAYTTFNTLFLGFCHGDTEVGYFTTATKLYTIIMSAFTAFTTVMVPRISELMAEGNISYIQSIMSDVLSLLLAISIPVVILCEFFSYEIIMLLSGPGYDGAIVPFKIVIFLLIIIVFEQVVIPQFLMATKSNNAIMWVSLTGACIGLSLNILITPYLAAIGSALCWGISELSVLIVGMIMLKIVVKINLDFSSLVRKIPHVFIYIIPTFMIYIFIDGLFLRLIFYTSISLLIFYYINVIVEKNAFLLEIVKKIPFLR